MTPRERDPDEVRLTPREAQVAAMVVNGGLSNKAIAARLGISVKTVEVHIDNIAKRLPGIAGRPRHRITVFYLTIRDPSDPADPE